MKILSYLRYKHRFSVISLSVLCEKHVPSEKNVGVSSAV